jgi:1-acyl-sn-glycerol-3-phosphate acyltransferase
MSDRRQRANGREGGLEERLLERLGSLAREVHPGLGERAFDLDSSLASDLGLDSLARVELLARLERDFGVLLAERAVFEAETPRDLVALIRDATPAPTPAVPAPTHVAAARAPAAHPPETLQTLVEVLDWHLERHAELPLLTLYADDGETPCAPLSYADLASDALATAAGLQDRGIAAGDAVAIMLPTGRHFFAAFYGAMVAGAVPVPLYPPARPAQLEDHLKRIAGVVANARARALLTDERARSLGRFVRARAPCLELIATVEALSLPGAKPARPALRRDSTALLQYTSGSTGDPKGVVLSHANLLSSLHAMWRASGVTSADLFVSWLPLYHDMGLIGAALGSMVVGFPLVLMSPVAFLARPVRWLRAIDRHRATISAGPNFAYELCVAKIADEDLAGVRLDGWRLAFNGAEPVSAATIDRFVLRFAPWGFRRESVMPVYGLAEATLGVTFPPAGRGPRFDVVDRQALMREGRARAARDGDPRPLRVVSNGSPLPGHEVRIVDDRGREVEERVEGRVEFRGPSATAGYFDNAAANAKLFDGDWLATGDLGYLADGELYLTGREKDVIIRAGANVHPQELETAAGGLPGVRKGGVVAFAASDPASGTERLVVLAETNATDAGERARLRAAIAALVSDLLGMPPDDVVVAGPRTVLKTSSGKLRRAACRELYERGALGERPRSVGWQLARLATQSAVARARRSVSAAEATLWSAWAWAVFGLVALAAWTVVLLLRTPHARRRALRVLARRGFALAGVGITALGAEELPDRPCIVVANHSSYADALVLAAVLPPHFAFAAKDDLASAPLLGGPLRRIGTAFVARSEDERGALGARALQARVVAGESLVFFPEGTFQRAAGLLPFKLGAFAVAATARAPVVPVAIRGTRNLLRAGRWLPRRGAVEVRFAAAIDPAGGEWTEIVALRDAARRTLLALTGEPDLGAAFEPLRRAAAAGTPER